MSGVKRQNKSEIVAQAETDRKPEKQTEEAIG
jgi:hypothetical protein